MPPKQHQLHGGNRGSALAIRVTPRAKKNEIAGILSNGTVKIRLTAPPVEGKANEALIEFLSGVFDVSRSQIEIVAGAMGRDKIVSFLGVDAETLQERLMKKIA